MNLVAAPVKARPLSGTDRPAASQRQLRDSGSWKGPCPHRSRPVVEGGELFATMDDARFNIRSCQPKDEEAVYEVCLKTGDAGKDATHLYTDPKALGHIFVGPYMRLEPELAFVLEDAAGVCGYVLGALDSARFYKRFLERWLPAIRRDYPRPTGDPARWTPTERIYHQSYHPEVYYPDSFRDYPSHMHIDLLPRAQGRGQGRLMVQTLLERLRSLGSPGVHLAMDARNSRAERFYHKLGFVELSRMGEGEQQNLYLGRRL